MNHKQIGYLMIVIGVSAVAAGAYYAKFGGGGLILPIPIIFIGAALAVGGARQAAMHSDRG